MIKINTIIKIFHIGLLILSSVLLLFSDLLAQENKWEKEISEDGNTEVVYAIYDSLDNKVEKTFIEYSAKSTTSASIKNCIRIFNNPEMHKKFYEYTDKSEKIEVISENEWIIYYYYSPPWPIADSDCVSRISMIADSNSNKVVFNSRSEPSLIETRDVVRSELNNISFTFTEIDSGKVEIFVEAVLIPETPAPNWMISSWFPEGPAGTISRFKKLAENL